MGPKVARGEFDPAPGRGRVGVPAGDPHDRVGIDARQHEMLERLGALERPRVGDEHAANRAMLFRHRENRSYAIGDEPFECVARLRHHAVLEEPAEAEDAHVVVADEVDRDLEGIADLLVHAVWHTLGDTAGGELGAGRRDLGRCTVVPLFPEFGGRRLEPDAHRLRTRPVEPHGVGYGQTEQFRARRAGDFERVVGDRIGGAARTEPDENPLDHGGLHSGGVVAWWAGFRLHVSGC